MFEKSSPPYCMNKIEPYNWLRERRQAQRLHVRAIRLSESREWSLHEGRIVHRSGGFFSVIGLRAKNDRDRLAPQPIIEQPEIGILGFLLHRREDGPAILLQAKAEPGNVERVQIAPTVQATVSNYSMKHGGSETPYLEYFQNGCAKISDSVQSEQGNRFLDKYNRNVLVNLAEAPKPVSDDWRWARLSDVLSALRTDYVVNTDARSVLVSADWRDLVADRDPFGQRRPDGSEFGSALHESYNSDGSISEILDKLDEWRTTKCELAPVHLNDLPGWRLDDHGVRKRGDGGAFEVNYFDVRSNSREVPAWSQPLFRGLALEQITLVCQRQQGLLRFLVKVRQEIGFRNKLQLAPSVQFFEGCEPAPALHDLIDQSARKRVRAATCQSDEGGRFQHSRARYRIVELMEDFETPPDDFSLWPSLSQLQQLVRVQGATTNELRSAVSLLLTEC